MTEQLTREKKIAEIRDWAEGKINLKEMSLGAGEAISFLLSELDRERAEVNKLRGALSGAATAANIAGEELKKIREERDRSAEEVWRVKSDTFELFKRLREERDRLIEGLRDIATRRTKDRTLWIGETEIAHNTLKSIGIDV